MTALNPRWKHNTLCLCTFDIHRFAQEITTRRAKIQRPPIAALLIYISGNLHVGSTPTPNAVNAFHRLQKSLVPFRLRSNTSKESTGALFKQLEAMGFGGLHQQGTQSVDDVDSHGASPS